MTDHIIKAAREADPGFDGGPDADGTMTDSLVGIEAVKRFYAIAYRAGLEDAANIVQANALACDPGSMLQVYLASNAAAIRALMKETP